MMEKPASLRMRDLEARTGVGRETIRFYLRQGLLPEPQRPKRNVALYSEAHVARLLIIKDLQERRFLPLSVIKALLDDRVADDVLDISAFPHLRDELTSRLRPFSDLATLVEFCESTGLPETEISSLAEVGLVKLQPNTEGQPCLDSHDMIILRHWARLRQAGFTEERGFSVDLAKLYLDFAHWLAGQEIRLFYDRLANRVDGQDAAAMAATAVPIINDIVSLLRERAIHDRLEALHALDITHNSPQKDPV